jgi:hypothetical protein
MESKI